MACCNTGDSSGVLNFLELGYEFEDYTFSEASSRSHGSSFSSSFEAAGLFEAIRIWFDSCSL